MNLLTSTIHEPFEPTSIEARQWEQFRLEYTDKVFCPALFPEVREMIASAVRLPRVLDMGCGPTALLLNELARRFPDAELYASDFSRQMLDAARSALENHRSVQFVEADHRDLKREFGGAYFDTVVSINSILPEKRQDVDRMISQVAEVLKPAGHFVALLPAFETSHMARDHWGIDIQIDDRNHREFDTTGWQCFYTEQIIRDMLPKHGFANFSLRPYQFNSQWARNIIRKIYGREIPDAALIKYPLFEHFVVAQKTI